MLSKHVNLSFISLYSILNILPGPIYFYPMVQKIKIIAGSLNMVYSRGVLRRTLNKYKTGFVNAKYKYGKLNYPNSAFTSSTAKISSKYFALILFDLNEFLSILKPFKSVALMKTKLLTSLSGLSLLIF